METEQPERVYVAIGTDLQDGFSTLQWTLNKWSNQEISIVILNAASSICRDYVYTPLGKLPVSSVSEEKIKLLEKTEEAKRDKILSQYITFCGKVKAEVHNIEKNELSIDKQIVETISALKINKLVMSLTFMKPSSWKSRPAISGSFYVLRQKPDYCRVFLISGGRLVFLREENGEGLIENDRGLMVAKFRERNHSLKNWVGKLFADNAVDSSPNPPSSSRSNISNRQWEKCSEEIERYVNQLLSLHEGEEEISIRNDTLKENFDELDMPENMDAAQRIQILKQRIENAQDAIKLNRKQASAAKERHEKAGWAINMCKNRAEKLDACINEEVMKNVDLKKELNGKKEELNELQCEVEEKRRKVNSILELQNELSNKLKLSSSAKSRSEIQLDKAVRARAEMVHEIEELRKYRDVLQRRIEFCREKDAIEKVSKSNGLGFDVREFTAAEVRAATEDFSQRLRLKIAGQWTNVYRGRINHITVAIRMYNPTNKESQEAFKAKVNLLGQVRHPNLLAMIGFCSELNFIVYEYMSNGNLRDALFLPERSCKRKNQPLTWHARICIAAEICSALGFLHKAKPKPIIHGNLNPSKILLDQNNVAKLNGLKAPLSYDASDIKSDFWSFGNLVLQLLTGKNWEVGMDFPTVMGRLDRSAGEWPTDLAMEFCSIAMWCLSNENGFTDESITALPMREINDVKKKADQIISHGELFVPIKESINAEDCSSIPSTFLCPIYQDVMQNPHLAADGFSYERDAIEEWLQTGHDSSPMTNLRLQHKLLIPNHTLRSLIQDWLNKRSATPT